MYTVGIITASDKGYLGEREDLSGAVIEAMVQEAGYKVVSKVILPDEQKLLEAEMRRLSDFICVNLILTTGGTGFSPRDITPEATLAVIERETPGISEAIRNHSMKITSKAMLSRARSGIRGKTLIVNLPGSPKAVMESLEYIIKPIFHGIQILVGDDSECGNQSHQGDHSHMGQR